MNIREHAVIVAGNMSPAPAASRTRTLALAALLACVSPGAPAVAATLLNGDFELGNTGFTSSYTYVDPASNLMQVEGTYTVGPSPAATSPYWPTDPSGASGNMLIVNGANPGSQLVWTQQVTGAVANQRYTLGASFASLVSGGASASLQFTVDDVAFGGVQTVTTTSFSAYAASFVAPSASFTLRLVNFETAALGNDFAVDNLSIAAVPEPHEWAMLLVGLGLVGWAARRRNAAPPVAVEPAA
jgi:hypothetical protein